MDAAFLEPFPVPLWLIPIGLAAGALTTVAGLGGGQLLVLALSLLWDPRRALVTTAPALLIGNLHRLWLYRAALDRRVAGNFVAGALPGALLGGLLAVAIPVAAIHAMMIFATALAVARALKLWSFRPPTAALAPAGLGIGAFCATSSGAGLLVSPVLLAAGLTGTAYIATSSAAAASMHLGRLTGYGLGGIVGGAALAQAAVLGASILAGNLLGDRARALLDARSSRVIEVGTLVACVTLAVAGVGR